MTKGIGIVASRIDRTSGYHHSSRRAGGCGYSDGAKAHPRAPIVLVCMGMGPAADMDALHAMVAPVGGRAYRAHTPQALRTVLFDSIAHRTPHAGS